MAEKDFKTKLDVSVSLDINHTKDPAKINLSGSRDGQKMFDCIARINNFSGFSYALDESLKSLVKKGGF